MKRTAFIIMIIILILTPAIGFCEYEELYSEDVKNAQEKISISSESLDNVKEILPDFNLSQMVKDLSRGEFKFDFENIIKSIANIFVGEIKGNIRIMALLMAICLLVSLISNMQSAFEKKGIEDVINFAAFSITCAIAAESFLEASAIGQRAIRDMSAFSQGILPTMAFLLISSGAPVKAGAMQPVVYVSAQIITVIIKNVVLPLSFISLALAICSNINEAIKIKGVIKLTQKSIKWILTFLITIFIAVLTVTNFATQSLDSISGKALKFGVSTLIPVVGSSLSDALESTRAAASVVKSALGAAGIIFVIALCIIPLIKLGAIILIYKIASAFSEPLSESVSACLSDISDTLSLIFSMVSSVAVLTIISMSALLVTGG